MRTVACTSPTDGAIFVTRDGEPARVALPEGTPPPTGPIVWIP